MKKFVLLFVFGTAISCVFAFQTLGGLSAVENPANEEIQAYIKSTSGDIKAKAALALGLKSGAVFGDEVPLALAFKTQTVAGTFYYVKTWLGRRIFHVKLLQDLKGNLSVSAVKVVVDINEPIEYFY